MTARPASESVVYVKRTSKATPARTRKGHSMRRIMAAALIGLALLLGQTAAAAQQRAVAGAAALTEQARARGAVRLIATLTAQQGSALRNRPPAARDAHGCCWRSPADPSGPLSLRRHSRRSSAASALSGLRSGRAGERGPRRVPELGRERAADRGDSGRPIGCYRPRLGRRGPRHGRRHLPSHSSAARWWPRPASPTSMPRRIGPAGRSRRRATLPVLRLRSRHPRCRHRGRQGSAASRASPARAG